ncbi:hypothetical protein [Streptomyces mutomycini]|uniref:hypothetical protein n=1 Tax=Streptomyces mutomycini TaxID=284036 RepID=UPI000ABFBAFC
MPIRPPEGRPHVVDRRRGAALPGAWGDRLQAAADMTGHPDVVIQLRQALINAD